MVSPFHKNSSPNFNSALSIVPWTAGVDKKYAFTFLQLFKELIVIVCSFAAVAVVIVTFVPASNLKVLALLGIYEIVVKFALTALFVGELILKAAIVLLPVT